MNKDHASMSTIAFPVLTLVKDSDTGPETSRSDAPAAKLTVVTEEFVQTSAMYEDELDDSFQTSDEPEKDKLPVVLAIAGERPKVLEHCQKLLRGTGKFFTDGTRIVTIQRNLVTGDASIIEASKEMLRIALAEVSDWRMQNPRTEEWRRVDVPADYCNSLLRQKRFDGLQQLVGLARHPFLRDDGSLCATPGYDPASRRYGVFEASDYPAQENPSRTAAEAALGRLNTLIDEFPFAAPNDRSAALSAIITAAVRPSLPLAPMFLVTAPSAGTGKTFLCDLISAIASPRKSSPLAFPTSQSDCEKVLHAELLQSPAVLFFDNLSQDVQPFSKLCSVLTSEWASGRTLGKSETPRYTTRTLVLATGNNVKATQDMARRCVTITLDTKSESPASRSFKVPNLYEHVLNTREQIVTDALMIIRAWIAEGSPEEPVRSLVSFTEWGQWCRQPLLWLGQADPLDSVFKAMEDDPEKKLLSQLMKAWKETIGMRPVMVRGLVESATIDHDAEELKDVLIEISDQGETINRRRIGKWIAKRAGQVAGGFRIEAGIRTGNAEVWKLAAV